MTDPTGLSFLSYRRTRAAEAKLLIEAQRDHGIPTWQDISDLPTTPTEPELRRVLQDPSTASGVLFVTPEVETSAVIRNVEAPLILERHLHGHGFFALPVAAGGLAYGDLPRVLGPQLGIADIAGWNVHKPAADPLNHEAAARIAELVLNQRLAAVNRTLPTGDALKLEIGTRAPLPKQAGAALAIDLTHRFAGRLAATDAWDAHILPAIDRIVRGLQIHGGRRNVTCRGLVAISAAVALGSAFLSLAGVRVSWIQDQRSFGDNAEAWGLHVPRQPSGFRPQTHPRGRRRRYCAPGLGDERRHVRLYRHCARLKASPTRDREYRSGYTRLDEALTTRPRGGRRRRTHRNRRVASCLVDL